MFGDVRRADLPRVFSTFSCVVAISCMVRVEPPAWCGSSLLLGARFPLIGTRCSSCLAHVGPLVGVVVSSCMVHGVPPDLCNVLIVVVFAWFSVFFCMVHAVSCAWCLSVLLHGRYLIDCLELSQNEQNVRKIILNFS